MGMRQLSRIIAASFISASTLDAQTRHDTLAVFDAAAAKMGMSQIDLPTNWRVRAGDSLTLRFAAHRRQPTAPAPEGKVYCSGGVSEAEPSGSLVVVELAFKSATKAVFSLFNYCTIRRPEKTWGFMQGDIVTVELRNSVWVATELASLIS